jgi:hypothetical protein
MERATPTDSGMIINGNGTVLRSGKMEIMFGTLGRRFTFSSDLGDDMAALLIGEMVV